MEFRRKNIRLHSTRYRGQAWFFITLCCEARSPIFIDGKIAGRVIECLKSTAKKCHFPVHSYCVMPDHFHALVEGTAQDSNLLFFVSIFKRATTIEYSAGSGLPLWQKQILDHILRPKDSPEAVAWYIWMNPVRKGLCSLPDQYPFSGSFTERREMMAKPKESWVPTWKKDKAARS